MTGVVRWAAIRELLSYNDWGRDRVMSLASGLSEQQLDQPFEMGSGSLRATLHHMWGAERVWLNRWVGADPAPWTGRLQQRDMPLEELWALWRQTAAERDAFLESQCASAGGTPDDGLGRRMTVTMRDRTRTLSLGDMVLHVANHGVHHRAQALNMLKRLGAPIPRYGIDYIFMKLEQPGGGTPDAVPPEVDLDTVRTYYGYADWARGQVHRMARGLSDEALDRPFEIGPGTLRRTLLHICFAERWWYQNWTEGPERPFPELDERTSIPELEALFDDVAAQRNAFIAGLTDPDLKRRVEARPRPGVTRIVPLGVSMLQLCQHGTHHRAQALNMLRHLGAPIRNVDYILMVEERQTAGQTAPRTG